MEGVTKTSAAEWWARGDGDISREGRTWKAVSPLKLAEAREGREGCIATEDVGSVLPSAHPNDHELTVCPVAVCAPSLCHSKWEGGSLVLSTR